MRKLRSGFALRALLAGGAFLTGDTLVIAQIEQLPETSRSEAQVDQLNRVIGSHEQIRGLEQQQQFDDNQLQIQRQTSPSYIRPPTIGRVRP